MEDIRSFKMLINRHESTKFRASKRIDTFIRFGETRTRQAVWFLHRISFDSPRPSSHIFLNLFPNSLRSLRGICRNTIELFAPDPCAGSETFVRRIVDENVIVEGCRHASWKNNFTNNGTATRVRATNSYAPCAVKSALSTPAPVPISYSWIGTLNVRFPTSTAQVCSREITDGQRETRRGKKRERNCCATRRQRNKRGVQYNSFLLSLSCITFFFFFSYLLVLFVLELAFPSNSRRNALGALIRRR